MQKLFLCYLDLSWLITSETLQSSIKQSVSSVVVVIAFPCFIRCNVFAEIPCLKINSYSVIFLL